MALKRPRKRKKLERPRFRRGLSILPSLFTMGNLFCGYFAIIATLRGNFDHAAIAIGIGAVLDTLDGRIARLTKTASEFGVQLDSLADVLTFGAAPAMLAFNWGLVAFAGFEASIAKHVNQLGWLATFTFVMCVALRLARFNIQSSNPPETTSKKYFVGLPSPAGAGIVAAVVHYFKDPIQLLGSALWWYVLVLLISFLMISTVRYYSFKEVNFRLSPRLTLLAAGMLIGLIIFYSEVVLLSLAVTYISSGPIMKLTQMVRRFLPSSMSNAEPAHDNIQH